MVGNPEAVRAVGSACASNPPPIVQPRHRVLRGDGTLGGYAGGIAIESALPSLEAGPWPTARRSRLRDFDLQ